MRKNIIAVCDTDGEYACNFAEYLNSRKKVPFEAEAFTDMDKLRTYAGKHPPEILLIAEQDADEQVDGFGTENVILLSEERHLEEEGHKYIYKYQSAESVIQEVMAYYVENTSPGFYALSKKKTDMIGIYSPVGRCSKTLLALTMGQILGEKRAVLYLNMEAYSGFEGLFHLNQERNLTDLFYTFRCKEQTLPEGMKPYVTTVGNMDMIMPAVSLEDLRSIEFSEWMKLFELIHQEKRYEIVILDLSSIVDQIFNMLSLCNHVYMPVERDRMSQWKCEQFRKLIGQWGGMEEEKIKELSLPVCNVSLEDPEFLKMLSWGKWGDSVRKVLEKYEGI